MQIVVLLLGLHAYLAVRLLPALGAGPTGIATGLLIAATLALVPAAFVGRRSRDRRVADHWTWVGMTALGVFSMLLVLTLLRDLMLLAGMLVGWAVPAGPSAAAVPLLALAAAAVGAVGARRTASVKPVDVPIPGLPPALDGFTIVQVSDLHVGPTVKREMVQRIVDAINRLQPDAVAITGDLVDGAVRDLQDDVAPLAALRARYGSFFVTGNHEYYSGVADWTAALQRLGLQVLENAHRVIELGGARLVMAGVSDFSAARVIPSHRSDPRQALAGAPADAAVRVLLAHQPRSAPAAADAGFDLQLSGHTHGGQFWPWNLLVRLQQPFTAGLHRLGRLWVYTSRGTG